LAGSSIRAINLASLGTLLTGDTPGRGRGLKTAPRSIFNVNASQWGDIVGVGGYSPSHSYQAQVTPSGQVSTLRRLAPIGVALAAGLGAYAVHRRKKKRRKRRGVRQAARRSR
jgi:hypothetical protein